MPAHAGKPLLVVHSSLCLCVCLCCVVLGCGWVGLAGWVLVRVLNVVVGARAQRGGVLNVVAFSTRWRAQRDDMLNALTIVILDFPLCSRSSSTTTSRCVYTAAHACDQEWTAASSR